MPLGEDLKTSLLGAIETNQLVFLCGAGLSIPSPSDLPSAAAIANICYDRWYDIEQLAPELRDDVDKLAAYFYKRGDFISRFMSLVPWDNLAGEPNKGHATVADLLICGGAQAALSANFDTMIERWAAHQKVAMRGALTGQEAVDPAFIANCKPLVKFHGCMHRERDTTLWTTEQLAEPSIGERVQSCSQWINYHLPGKDLVVVGFWTDWGYLNGVLAEAFGNTNARSVTVIDPCPRGKLQAKAPILWEKLTQLSNRFEHVQASSEAILEEIRVAYSRSWARKFYALGKSLAEADGIAYEPSPDALDCEALYNLRRDVEGLPYTQAAARKSPPEGAGAAAYSHIKLLSAGAIQEGAWLTFKGYTVRVVNGAGRGLNDMRENHLEPSSVTQPDIVLCAGSIDLGVPAKLIDTGKGDSIVSPSPGAGARWLTHEQAFPELGL